ncbi:uncharacterized protein LOC114945957 [Nylanderia fulva]|uniref:uncharacterized protein LOC114945957 n=1 Tax=Nylanderia fulva TaxID=613905 RepID=UPI0010FB5557|nr:uncharacterized protein LOC114945957 [Nylanderia fulva]
MTYAVTKNRMETLKKKFEQCSKLDAKLHASADSKEKTTHPYFSDHEFDECEEAYETALDYFAEVVHELSKSSAHPAANVSHLHDCQSHTTLNLPKVTLPVFDGSFDKWESFRDRFQSMIIEEKSLSNVQKLHHLFSCLKGEALTAIKHLTITSDNFAVAWTILSSNFENERRLINSYIHRLFTLPNVTAKSATELRALQSKLTAAIAALKNLSRPVEHWSDIFVYIITQRLDKSSREAWELKLGKTTVYPTFDEISAFLDSRIRALNALVPIASTLDKQSDKSNAKLKQRAVTLHTTSATKLSCPVCESNHLLYQCTAFLGKRRLSDTKLFVTASVALIVSVRSIKQKNARVPARVKNVTKGITRFYIFLTLRNQLFKRHRLPRQQIPSSRQVTFPRISLRKL